MEHKDHSEMPEKMATMDHSKMNHGAMQHGSNPSMGHAGHDQ